MNLAEAYNLIIDFHHDFEDLCSIYFVRRQFPLRLYFTVTINKSQGQMFSGRIGIYLKKDAFALGHIYVPFLGLLHLEIYTRATHLWQEEDNKS
jgi:hypothetical protein